MEQFVSGWFFGQDPELITEQDFIEWTACTFFNVTVQELSMEQEYMCFQLLKVVNAKLGRKFIKRKR
jgi:hypothetical protein